MKGRSIPYSKSELAWLEKNRTLVISEYATRFRAKFNRADVTDGHLHALRKRRGWKTGRTGCFEKGLVPHNKGKPMPFHPNSARTQFKKGNLPRNTKYLGHERVSKGGYVEISIKETNPHTGFDRRYVLKHRWLWEQTNGPVPEGYALKCLDGDKANCDPSNWEVVPRSLLPRLAGGNRYKRFLSYDEAPPELKPIVMTAAKLALRVRDVRK